MSENSANSKRIAKNTLMLYFRQIITMAVSLYTSRVVLSTLGVEDYGIYNVVGGLVGMFSILTGSLSSAISRFITYELGSGNRERLRLVFSTAVTVQFILAIIIVILLEVVGVWFLYNKLDIPSDRLDVTAVVLHISMLTTMVNLISIPYNALIIAHEKMSAFAYISFLEVLLKLVFVFLLNVIAYDKLLVYAWLLFGLSVIIRSIYGIYSKRNFEESKYQFVVNIPLIKEMFCFAGWNFIGSSAGILKNQGVSMILNMFFGPIVNAARAIAMQINTALNSFVANFMTAMNPQITKSYAAGDHNYMKQLVYKGSKYSYYLLLLLSLPVLFETKQILSLWLVEVPNYTLVFVRLILIDTLVTALATPMVTAQLATGNIKNYQIVVGGLHMMNLPLSYLCLKLGLSVESVLYVAITLSVICLFVRLFFLKHMISLSIRAFVKCVLLKVFFVSTISVITPLILCSSYSESILRMMLNIVIGTIISMLVIYLVGIDRDEKLFINSKIAKIKFINF